MRNSIILVDYNVKSIIVNICQTSFATVKKALNGEEPSKKYEKLYAKIRKVALEHDGIEKPRKIYISKVKIENVF